MVIYHAPPAFNEKMAGMKEEEMVSETGRWETWGNKLGDALVDFGRPLGGGMKIMKSGTEVSKREVSGYSIIEADSMEDAIELMKDHPHLMMDDMCEIEIHTAFPPPGP